MAKKAAYGLLLFLLVVIALFLWQVWQNNKDVTPLSHSEIKPHFDRSVSWLKTNYSTFENHKNPILWWMINQAAQTSNNESLKNIYSKYKKDHIDDKPPNLSTPMFNKFYRPRLPDISQLSDLDDYQIFFLYATSCDKEIGSEVIIQKQMVPDFCALHYVRPRCITHQLMGLRFMQRYQCGYNDTILSTIPELQNTVLSELTWDFRIGDAYIQRVLMLVETGAFELTKPIWIKNILNAQNDDGSWDDLHPLLYVGNGKFFGLTSTLPKVKTAKANFHATIQAIWLLSLLLDKTAAKNLTVLEH